MSPPQILPDIPEVLSPQIELAGAAPAPQPVEATWPWHARWWDRLSLYLPVLLMGALALGTWWLLQSAPGVPRLNAPSPESRLPDYAMRGFELQRFDERGQLRARLIGESLSHWPQGDRLQLQGVSLSLWDPDGGVSQARAERAQTSQGLDRVELTGGVRLERQPAGGGPGWQVTGEGLSLWADRGEILSALPVVLVQGRSRIEAARLRLDYRGRVVELQGGVQTRIEPAGKPS
jgi:lipopolysaccharide export system protein LptC